MGTFANGWRSGDVVVLDCNLLDLDRWQSEGAPYEWFVELRSRAPVWRHPSPDGGPGFWVISRYDDVISLARNHAGLSSNDDHGGVFGLGPGDELQARNDGMDAIFRQMRSTFGDDARGLLTLDPPEHTRHRRSVYGSFKSNIVSRLESQVRWRVSGLLDALPAWPFNFVTQVAKPLASHTAGDLLGAPSEDHQQLMSWTDELVSGNNVERALAASAQLFQYFLALQEAHAEPCGEGFVPLVSALTTDGSMSSMRINIFLSLVATASNESTSAAISHAARALSEFPDEWERLRRDPSLIPSAVEEILRWASPAAYFRRNAMVELKVRGETIEAGDVVSFWYLSANRDEERFVEPDKFDIGRSPNPHVAFGGGGPHFCLGAHLARLELRVLLEELVARYRSIDLVGPIVYLRSNAVNGIANLPIELTAS